MRNQSTFKNNLPTVYLVGTPIGNLADISFRAIEVLQQADIICCEDTRTSNVFLHKYKIEKHLISLHMHNEKERVNLITKYLQEDKTIAIISDAGCPTISDPGAALVNQLLEKNIFNITSVNVGPAYVHAIVASGFIAKENHFYGFLNSKNEAAKIKELKEIIKNNSQAIISFYESVHRVKETINVLNLILEPDQQILIARELTKRNEQYLSGTIQEIYSFSKSENFISKGEFVIVIDKQKLKALDWTNQQIIDQVNELIRSGCKLKQACEKTSQITSKSKNDIYNLYVKS